MPTELVTWVFCVPDKEIVLRNVCYLLIKKGGFT